jgi:hypothetical protein
MLGHGMRESSGEHCCGRDQSADNFASDTQKLACSRLRTMRTVFLAVDKIMNEYQENSGAGTFLRSKKTWSAAPMTGIVWVGSGFQFQERRTSLPSGGDRRDHATQSLQSLWSYQAIRGELRKDADEMFKAVQTT